MERQESGKAERLLKKMLKVHPNSAAGNFELGRIYLLQDRFDPALVHLEVAVTQAPQFSNGHLAIGYALEAKGDKKGALESFQRVLELTPENNELRNHVIGLLLSLNNPEAAIEQNERLKFFKHDAQDVHYNKAMILFHQGQYGQAVEQLEIVLGKDPNHTSARYFLANAHIRLRNYEEAIDQFGRFGPNDHLYLNAVEARAYLLRKVGRLTEARDMLEQALQSHPESTGLYRVAGLVYSTLGRHDLAEGALKKAIELKPEDADLVYTLANVYEKSGRFQKGIRLMEKVLAENPDNIDALNYIGYTLADHGQDFERSLQLVRRAQQLRPEDGYITDSVGWVLFLMGRHDEAITQLERAVEIVPDEPVILEHLGDVYQKVGRTQDALKTYIRARESNPEPDQVDRILKKIQELGG